MGIPGIFTDVDECEAGTHTCDENAECTNTEGSFNCTCQSSYFGDGFDCLREINNYSHCWNTIFIIELIAVGSMPMIAEPSVQGNLRQI